jgi:hypothetical protein
MMTPMWNLMKKSRRSERRSDGRMPAPDLDVSYATERERRKARIKDISATGLYLFTDEPLQPGTKMDLTLQRCSMVEESGSLDPAEDEPRANVHLRAQAVRVGQDGVGVAFSEGRSEAASWANLMSVVAKLTGETDQVRLFRMTKALGFVVRVSPAAERDMVQIITNRMSLERAGRAIEIALHAEEIAAAHQGGIRSDVPANLVLRILEDGSKVDEEQTRLMWAELLASSCYEGSKDEVNMHYAGLMSRIDAVQMRIVDASCRLAMRVGWGPGFKFNQDMYCSADEIKKVSHIQNLMGIERDLNHLFELGLLEQTDRPILCQQVERVNMAPTFLALRLYARCKGQPEPPESLEGAKLQWAS